MAFFSRRDRIAIACIGVLVLTGWGLRLMLSRESTTDDIRIIRKAVDPPPFFSGEDSAGEAVSQENVIININTADASALELLPMIGPTRASAIIKYREQHGPFGEKEEIMLVPGIGKGIYGTIESLITLQDTLSEVGN
jgi:competence protein ComEA